MRPAEEWAQISNTWPNAPSAFRAALAVSSVHESATTTIHKELRQPDGYWRRRYRQCTFDGLGLIPGEYDNPDCLDYRYRAGMRVSADACWGWVLGHAA